MDFLWIAKLIGHHSNATVELQAPSNDFFFRERGQLYDIPRASTEWRCCLDGTRVAYDRKGQRLPEGNMK